MTDDDRRGWPLTLSAPHVRAVLDGTKTEHRVPVTPANSTVLGYPAKRYWPDLWFAHAVPRRQATLFLALLGPDKAPPDPHLDVPYQHPGDAPEDDIRDMRWYRVRPKWEAGDRLWVKEDSYIAPPDFCDPADATHSDAEGRPRVVGYAASMDGESVRCATDYGVKKTPSIFMPRWASRVTLEVTGVRGEKSESAEGGCGWAWVTDFKRVTPCPMMTPETSSRWPSRGRPRCGTRANRPVRNSTTRTTPCFRTPY